VSDAGNAKSILSVWSFATTTGNEPVRGAGSVVLRERTDFTAQGDAAYLERIDVTGDLLVQHGAEGCPLGEAGHGCAVLIAAPPRPPA